MPQQSLSIRAYHRPRALSIDGVNQAHLAAMSLDSSHETASSPADGSAIRVLASGCRLRLRSDHRIHDLNNRSHWESIDGPKRNPRAI